MIRIENIVKKYGDFTVIDNISLKIKKGNIVSFIGPNGAGKSTLLGIISRLTEFESGKVYIDDIELKDWNQNELAKKISILKQSNFLSMRLTIEELVSFGRFPYSQGRLTDEDWDYINNAIEYMKLRDIKDKYLDQLSGGQRQRAFIAMIIAQNTEYILLDEPLNNLDMKHSVEMMKILRNLVDDYGKTIVLVLHDINFASCYSDYIFALKDGKVYKEGDINVIITKEVLDNIYNIDFDIQDIENKKICVYF
ncbi:TPA: ATP-binding cassette domain-containing protein [bacterium]|jgi:iron complex transport system ATP-binding protein|nr:ATP-binding cassette domain-containing protein [bacterium]